MASAALERLKTRGDTEGHLQFPNNLGSDKSKYYMLFKVYKTSPQTVPLIEFQNGAGNEKAVYLKRPEVEDKQYIALYMPASITNSQNASYQSAELGIVASVLTGLQGKSAIDFSATDLATVAGESLVKGLKSGSAEAQSLAAVGQISQGKVVNNRTELIFDNIDRRSFTFDFKMIPRTEDEAKSIKDIVKKFRANMAPNFAGSSSGKSLIVPSTFEIEFKPNDNGYLPKIGRSICTSCNVTYGGARPQFYEGGSPVETSMTITFQELEMITKQRIESGY